MFILILLGTIFLTIIYRLNLIKNVYLKLTIKYLIFSIFLGFIIEITIFNYRFYDTILLVPGLPVIMICVKLPTSKNLI